MTLNLMLTSRSAVYLSGVFFRLSYRRTGRTEDNLNTQKLVPVFKFGWSALVSYTGVANTSRGMDVGQWIAQAAESIEMYASFDELPRRLLSADAWLNKVRDERCIAFSIVGFNGRRPVAALVSNFTNLDGYTFPVQPKLKKSISKPKVPEARVAGDRAAVAKDEIQRLKAMIVGNRNLMEIHNALAETNAEAAQRSSVISRECVVGCLLPTGAALVRPYGIDEGMDYIPDFIMRDLARTGVT
jgi:hypothetical protein